MNERWRSCYLQALALLAFFPVCGAHAVKFPSELCSALVAQNADPEFVEEYSRNSQLVSILHRTSPAIRHRLLVTMRHWMLSPSRDGRWGVNTHWEGMASVYGALLMGVHIEELQSFSRPLLDQELEEAVQTRQLLWTHFELGLATRQQAIVEEFIHSVLLPFDDENRQTPLALYLARSPDILHAKGRDYIRLGFEKIDQRSPDATSVFDLAAHSLSLTRDTYIWSESQRELRQAAAILLARATGLALIAEGKTLALTALQSALAMLLATGELKDKIPERLAFFKMRYDVADTELSRTIYQIVQRILELVPAPPLEVCTRLIDAMQAIGAASELVAVANHIQAEQATMADKMQRLKALRAAYVLYKAADHMDRAREVVQERWHTLRRLNAIEIDTVHYRVLLEDAYEVMEKQVVVDISDLADNLLIAPGPRVRRKAWEIVQTTATRIMAGDYRKAWEASFPETAEVPWAFRNLLGEAWQIERTLQESPPAMSQHEHQHWLRVAQDSRPKDSYLRGPFELEDLEPSELPRAVNPIHGRVHWQIGAEYAALVALRSRDGLIAQGDGLLRLNQRGYHRDLGLLAWRAYYTAALIEAGD